MKTTRPYRQTTRAAAVQKTRDRILDSAEALISERWYDEVGVRELAQHAGVAPQTVISHFGSKPGVLAAVSERVSARVGSARDGVQPGDVDGAVAALLAEYEDLGDGIVKMIALEGRVPELAPILARGRAVHRGWIERVFADALESQPPAERERRTVALIAATDVLTWKVVRREQALAANPTRKVMTEMTRALLESWGVR